MEIIKGKSVSRERGIMQETPLKKYGKKLKSMRESAGLTQTEAACHIGVSKTTISQWECGNTVPSRDNINRITHVYRVQGEDLHFLDYLFNLTKKELIALVHNLSEDK